MSTRNRLELTRKIIGVVLECIGLAGIPGDVQTWGGAMGWIATFMNDSSARWAFVISGFMLFGWSWISDKLQCLASWFRKAFRTKPEANRYHCPRASLIANYANTAPTRSSENWDGWVGGAAAHLKALFDGHKARHFRDTINNHPAAEAREVAVQYLLAVAADLESQHAAVAAVKLPAVLSLGELQAELNPDGMVMFRIEVRNDDPQHRTIDDVSVRVVSLIRVDGGDQSERISIAKPLLAISGTGNMPYNPPGTKRNLSAMDSVLFDFVRVRCVRRANHSMCYGECEASHQNTPDGLVVWNRVIHDGVLRAGKYKAGIEIQGRNVPPIRKDFVFWGDKTGVHCVDAGDPSAASDEPLEYDPIPSDTYPPSMHPHQLRALVTALKRPVYDGMTADAVYRQLEYDTSMAGLSQVRFLTAGAMQSTDLTPGKWASLITDEEVASFPGGVPGFPNIIRRSDFDIAWREARIYDPLKLLFDDSTDVTWSNANCDLQVRFRLHNSSPSRSVDQLRVIGDFIPLDGTGDSVIAKELCGVPLRLSRELDRQREPTKTHALHPGETLEFILLHAQRGNRGFSILHAQCMMTDPMRTGNGVRLLTQIPIRWDQQPNGELTAGKYRITITARGKDAPAAQLALVVECEGHTLTVQQDQSDQPTNS